MSCYGCLRAIAFLFLLCLYGAVGAIGNCGANPASFAYPFADDMEDTGSGNWAFDPPWGYTADDPRSGAYCLTDSPGLYQNGVDLSATLAQGIDLSTAMLPVLTFWDRCETEAGLDYGHVEVSTDGGWNWTAIYYAGGSSGWTERRVDLTEYRGRPDVRIRFRLLTSQTGMADGWSIDDVSIQETPTPQLPYPFNDDMEAGGLTAANWLTGAWTLTMDDSHSPIHAMGSELTVPMSPWWVEYSSLTPSGTFDLSPADCPRLVFWYRARGGGHLLDVSTNGGETWTVIANYNGPDAWTRAEIDLTPYLSSQFRFRFRSTNNWYGVGQCLIDDVELLDGEPAGPPDIEITPRQIALTVAHEPGLPLPETASATLQIANRGESRLTYAILEAPWDGPSPPETPPNGAALTDVPWLQVTPENGAVLPHDSTEVTVTIHGSMDLPGPHQAWLIVLNNDPDENPLLVQVSAQILATSGIEGAARPTCFQLTPPFPNPAHGGTTFQCGLPEEAPVSLRIFDSAGRQVAAPAETSLSAGYHQIRWNAEGIGAGVYFYQYTAATFRRTGRLVLR